MSPFTGARRQLLTVLGGLLLIGLVMLVPDLAPPPADDTPPVDALHGRILEIVPADRGSLDGGGPPVATARVEILEGPRTGEVLTAFLEGPGGSQVVAGYAAGDEVLVSITRAAEGDEPYVAVADRWRIPSLQLLGLVFAVAVVAIGGWRGARALVALGLTVAVLLRILLPLVIAGFSPLPLAVVAATAITAMTILVTEGRSRATFAAILGTAGALAVTGLLAAAATALSQFTYTAGSDLAFLVAQGGGGLDLRGILLAAIILGAVGVLDDVTVTQAVVVEELAATSRLRGRTLFASAMGIGRSHIGATINTLFLAYVGAGLPLLVVLLVSHQPAALVFNDEVIATEIVRTLVGSLGIVTAVPLTTFVAVSLVGAAGPRAPHRAAALGAAAAAAGAPADVPPGAGARRSLAPVAAVAVLVGILLVATAVLPATQPDRAALPTPGAFEPPPSGLGPDPASADPGDPGDPGLPPGQPTLADRGEPVPIEVDGVPVGTVAVTRWALPSGSASGPAPVTVEVAYEAASPWTPDATAWELLTVDGVEIPLLPVQAPPALSAGQSARVTLRGEAAADALRDAFVAYVDRATEGFVLLVALE